MLAVLLIAAKWAGILGMIVSGLMRLVPAFAATPVTHYLTGMVSTLVFALAQVMTVFYFIGMQRSLQRACQRLSLDTEIVEQAVAIKKRVIARGFMLALLATTILILSGVTLTAMIPRWIHGVAVLITVVIGIRGALVEYGAFRANAALYEYVGQVIGAHEQV